MKQTTRQKTRKKYGRLAAIFVIIMTSTKILTVILTGIFFLGKYILNTAFTIIIFVEING